MRVRGGRPLEGTVRVPAAKNSVLPLLAAGLLCSGPVTLRQVPELSDVQASLALLRGLGCAAERQGSSVILDPAGVCTGSVPAGPARSMRSSVFYLAPLLHRMGRVAMPMPGGCDLGPRPIDIHLDGLVRMGAQVLWEKSTLTLRAERGLRGIDYTLRLPSVGATETLLMAASRAAGVTVLRGAACEPEIADLADFLRRCGAQITGDGTPTVVVHGVRELSGAAFTPMPDRITAATLACAAAAAGGRVRLQGCRPEQFRPVLELLRRAGCGVETGYRWAEVERSCRLRSPGDLCTGGYPGFPTDAAPLAAAALLTASGESLLRDQIFEHRFACAAGFARMGAGVQCEGRCLRIRGVEALHGAEVEAPDLRGGAALVLAALNADGESRIGGMQHIRRGYPVPGHLLAALGADVCTIREE